MNDVAAEPTKILFVCMGNICRSPAAECLFQHFVNERGDANRILIDSAGTISYHAGNPPDSRMSEAAANRGYKLLGRARQVTRHDLDEFDLILAMDRDNLSSLQSLATSPKGRVVLFSDFLDDQWPQDVPDPYYGGRRGFEDVLDMIEAACPAILAECQSDKSNS